MISHISIAKDYYSDGTIQNDTAQYKIAYYKDYVLYRIGSRVYHTNTLQQNGKIINEVRATNDSTFKFFIVNKTNDKGFFYNSIEDENGQKFSLDSLKESIGINNSNLEIFGIDLGIPKEIIKSDHSRSIIVERYDSKVLKDDADTIFRYYNSELKSIPFSFSPSLDSMKNSKLYKTRFIYLRQQPAQSNKVYLKRLELSEEIARDNSSGSNGLVALFKRFETQHKN